MKIISVNIRGLGGRVKKREIKNLVTKYKVDMLCIQETKLEAFNRNLCISIWGNDDVEWVNKSADGRSGGILILWRKGTFSVDSCVEGTGFIHVTGFWGRDRAKCNITNVYSPCSINEKRDMWASLIRLRQSSNDDLWCVVGDFNSIATPNERKGRGNSGMNKEMQEFNDFIRAMDLNDLPMLRRKFTWYRQDGSVMSRLDRFLLSDGWLNRWRHLIQVGLERSVSDHRPILLKTKETTDWGPKPFRVLDCWAENKNFVPFVTSTWNSLKITGTGPFALKEKLKSLKNSLKSWNKEVFGDLTMRIR